MNNELKHENKYKDSLTFFYVCIFALICLASYNAQKIGSLYDDFNNNVMSVQTKNAQETTKDNK